MNIQHTRTCSLWIAATVLLTFAPVPLQAAGATCSVAMDGKGKGIWPR